MALKKIVRGSQFLTGTPPNGMGLTFFVDEDGVVIGNLTLDHRAEGPPNHMHGGFSASLLDEAMGMAVWQAGHQVVAVHIAFDLKAVVPLNQPFTVRGWVEKKEGRKVFTASELVLPDGTVAVSGRGVFVEAPQIFEGFDFLGTHE